MMEKRILIICIAISTFFPINTTVYAVQGKIEEKEVETEQDNQIGEEQFLEDIVTSYNKRNTVVESHTKEEMVIMPEEELVLYQEECCEVEREFYEKYKDVSFRNLNIQYLCERYMLGLSKQYLAEQIWDESKDYDRFNDEYSAGYYNRAYMIVELAEYYHCEFGDISNLQRDTIAMDSINEAERKNAETDKDIIIEVQNLLNQVGFICGDADGVSGKWTIKSIKRFQEKYGYKPCDGIIDDELRLQLQEALNSMGGK